MAGLFFCLASAEGAWLLFCPAAIQSHISVCSAFCAVNAVYTANATKQRTGLYRGIPCYLPRFAVAVWRCIRLYRTAYTTLEHITAPGRYTGQRNRPIIIMYIRVQRCAPVMNLCQTVQHIADYASPAGQSSSRSVAGGAEPLAAVAVSLFGLSPDSQ